MKIAIPRMGESVAPCFEYCTTMAIYTMTESGSTEQVDFPLMSREPLDRVRLLREEGVDTVICGGMQEVYEDLLKASGFQVVSWVSGAVEDLLNTFLRGDLRSGMELPTAHRPDLHALDRMMEH